MRDKPANILIADNNSLYTKGLKAMLMTRKHLGNPDIANSVSDVFSLLKNKNYDLFLTTISEITSSGKDYILKVKRYFPSLKLLVILPEDDKKIINDSILSKINGQILKNSTPDEFFMLIEKTLQKGVIYNGDNF